MPRWLWRSAAVTLALASSAAALTGQLADSAGVARAEVRAANLALREGDSATALSRLDHARRAWPAQPAYTLWYANLAAAMRQADAAFGALRHLVALGGTWSERDGVARFLGGDPRYADAWAAMQRATGPLVRSTVLATLPDSQQHPEGLAWDGAGRRWLVSSIRERRIVAVDAAGGVTEFVPPGRDSLDAVFGLAVDSARGILWAATSAIPNQLGYTPAIAGRGALFAFRLADGALLQRVVAPVAEGGHVLGDLTLAPDGTVYVSDSRQPVVYRLRPGGARLEVLVAGAPDFRSLQGLALSEDGTSLYLADWSHGLLRVSLADGAVHPVPLEGPGTLLGIDGLLRVGPGTLLGVQNGLTPPRIVELTLDPTGTRVSALAVADRHLPLASEPTLLARGDGVAAYVANSPWSTYDDDGVVLAGAPWPRPVLLALPLPTP